MIYKNKEYKFVKMKESNCLKCAFYGGLSIGCNNEKASKKCEGGVYKKVIFRCRECNSKKVSISAEIDLNSRDILEIHKYSYYCRQCSCNETPKKCIR